MARNTNETRGGLNRKIRESSHKISWLVKSNFNAQELGNVSRIAFWAHSGTASETYPQTYPQNL